MSANFILRLLAVIIYGISGYRSAVFEQLSPDFYRFPCPNVDQIVFETVRVLSARSNVVAPSTLRLFFHDCFIQGASFIPIIWDAFQFTGAATAVCIGFIFPGSIALGNPYGISTKDRYLSLFMIFLAVVSCSIAIFSDSHSMFQKNEEGPPRS